MTAGRAAGDVRAAIEASGGAIPFSTYVELVLYGPHGFYTDPDGGGSAGRRGDFLTSPEVGPLFGAVLARHLDAEWVRVGRPDPFTVVDAGAGPGTLARSVLAARPACVDALRYVAVEVSGGQRARHPDGVVSSPTLPGEPFVGVIVANELLDNLPFRLAVYDDAWREAYVALDRDGSFAEVLSSPLDPVPACLPARPGHGSRAPLQDAAVAWVAAARRLVTAGSVLVVDYARPSTAELAMRPWREWLRTYRGHSRGAHPLADAGEQDITVDVALDQLPEPDASWSQRQFLARSGMDDLVEEGRRAWSGAARNPDLAALRMRSRVSEAEALGDPAGLGGFDVLQWIAPIR